MRKLLPFLWRFTRIAAQKGLSIGLGFITLMILTRNLNPTDMGMYFAIISAAGILATPFNGALTPFMLVETSRAGDDPAQVGSLVRKLLAAVCTYVLVLALISPYLLDAFGVETEHFSRFAPLLVLTLSLTALASSTLLGTGWTALSQVGDNVVRPIALLLAVVVLSRWSALSTATALAAVVVAQGAAVCVSGSIFVSRRSGQSKADSSATSSGRILRYGKYFLNAMAASLQVNLPTIMVASLAFSSTAEFALSQKLVALLAVAGSLIGIANGKAFADMAAAGLRSEAYAYFKRMLAASSLILLCPIALWVLLDDYIIRFAFGQQYTVGISEVTLWLLPAHVAFALVSPTLPFLYGVDMQHIVFYLQLCAVALLVGIGLWLTPQYGPKGMAAAYTISQVALYLAIFAVFRRETSEVQQ